MSVVIFKPRTWWEALPMIRAENEEWRRAFKRRKLKEEIRARNRAKRLAQLRADTGGLEIGRAGCRTLAIREN